MTSGLCWCLVANVYAQCGGNDGLIARQRRRHRRHVRRLSTEQEVELLVLRYCKHYRRSGVQANIFLEGGEPSLVEKFFDRPEKNCYYNLQSYFARLTPPSSH